MKNIQLHEINDAFFDIPDNMASKVNSVFYNGVFEAASFNLKPDALLLFSHDPKVACEEFIGLIMKGKVELTIAGESKTLKTGDMFKVLVIDNSMRIRAIEKSTVLIVAIGGQDLGNQYNDTINKCVDDLEKKDLYTVGHSKRVCNYSIQIGTEL